MILKLNAQGEKIFGATLYCLFNFLIYRLPALLFIFVFVPCYTAQELNSEKFSFGVDTHLLFPEGDLKTNWGNSFGGGFMSAAFEDGGL